MLAFYTYKKDNPLIHRHHQKTKPGLYISYLSDAYYTS